MWIVRRQTYVHFVFLNLGRKVSLRKASQGGPDNIPKNSESLAVFFKPVDTIIYTDYSKIIKYPMDLSQVSNRTTFEKVFHIAPPKWSLRFNPWCKHYSQEIKRKPIRSLRTNFWRFTTHVLQLLSLQSKRTSYHHYSPGRKSNWTVWTAFSAKNNEFYKCLKYTKLTIKNSVRSDPCSSQRGPNYCWQTVWIYRCKYVQCLQILVAIFWKIYKNLKVFYKNLDGRNCWLNYNESL